MDRQDIDALLIGALYGELTPADEARLAAHLESHPADRSALDGLQVARDAVKQSRIFDVQSDPPQAVSAILLQEAARRAPRTAPDPERREGWFQRFVRSFASHPAMAAAAMLVVVVGVAGTLYMRNGDQFAEKTASTPSATGEQQLDTTRPAPPSGAVASENGAQGADQANERAGKDNKDEVAAAGSAYSVALAEEQQLRKQTEVADKPQPKVAAPAKPIVKTDPAASDGEFAKAPAHTGKKGYIEVTTPERTPKEMESKNDDVDTGKLARGDVSGGEAIGGAGGAPAGPAGARPQTATTAAPPPPPPADEAPRSKAAPAPQKTAVAKAPAQAPAQAPGAPPPQAQAQPQAPATNSPLLAWAKSQHAEAVARVRKGDCSGAASIAVQVRNRAPDYFAQNMRDDRELKSCTAYITDAVDKEERANTKAKASKRATDSK